MIQRLMYEVLYHCFYHCYISILSLLYIPYDLLHEDQGRKHLSDTTDLGLEFFCV